MSLTQIAIKRPLAILMLIIALVIMGLVAMRLMKVDRLPNISYPFVGVNIVYPGTSPTDMETLVAKVAENGLAGVPGVFSLGSTSQEGRTFVSLQLVEGANVDQAAVDADRRIAAIRSRFPADVTSISVNRADPNASPIFQMAVTSSSRPLDQIYELTDKLIVPRLVSVLGVADVQIIGGLQQQVTVSVDYDKLSAYGVSVQQIQAALQRENVGLPAGSIAEGAKNINVRTTGQYQTPEDLGRLVIAIGPNGGRIYLRDLAEVKLGYKEITRLQRYNDRDAVGISITKQSDANTLQVADDIQATLAQLRGQLPADMRLIITNDASRFTRKSLQAVQFDLGLAILLTGFVLLLFLHTLRNVVIVLLAIPTSLVSTFLVMWMLGFSINTITLMALALCIGILVDDAIVVLENIHRHLTLGESPMIAALKGRSEIGLAAIAITLCDVVVYLPVAFMQGNVGKLFKEYGLTIAAATLFSLFISFTLTPMLASRWLKPHEHREDEQPRNLWERFSAAWERGFVGLGAMYRGGLNWALHHRPLIVLTGLGLLLAALSVFPLRLIGTEYAPGEDDGVFRVSLQMPAGTSLTATDEVMRQIEATLKRTPEVEGIFTSVGVGGGFGASGSNQGSITVQLKEKAHPDPIGWVASRLGLADPNEASHYRERSVWEIMAQLRSQTARLAPGASVQFSVDSPFFGGGGGGGLFVRLYGEDLTTLQEIADRVEQTMKGIPGVADVRNNANTALPELRVTLDRAKMADLGINAQQVAQAVRTSVGGTVVSQFQPQGRDQMDIMLIAEDSDRLDLNKLADIPLITTGSLAATGTNVPSGTGNVVRLGAVAKFERALGPSQIVRQDRQRVVTLNGSVPPAGRPLGEVAQDFRQAMTQVPMPPGYGYTLAGQVQQLEQAITALLSALSLSILLIYMLLVALYESWLHPLSVMFALPMALIGAIGGLLVTDNTFNIFSMIGMVMLMGIVAKNGILLVDYTNTLRDRGHERLQALLEAGPTRLKPIIMTTATIVFAMLPLALKFESGAETRAPLAVVVLGGVLTSTLLTLFVVPVMYTYFDDFQLAVRKLRFPRLRRRAAGQPVGSLREGADVAAGD